MNFIETGLIVHCLIAMGIFTYALCFKKMTLKLRWYHIIPMILLSPVLLPAVLLRQLLSHNLYEEKPDPHEGLLTGFSFIYLWMFVNLVVHGIGMLA